MSFMILPHTADVRLHVSGVTREDFFHDALLGMMTIAKPEGSSEEGVRRNIVVEAPDITALLIDFLNEVLVWMHTEHEAYTEIVFHRLDERRLEAELIGYRTESFGEDIKAVTYHEVEVVRAATGIWSATVVFDI